MHLDIAPRRIAAVPGQPADVLVTLANTSGVIVGCSLRVLGADPSWVVIEDPEPRLFPEQTAVIRLQITLPEDTPAGERRIVLQVRDLTDASRLAIEDIVLDVPAQPRLTALIEPVTVTAGRSALFHVTVANEGNNRQRGTVRVVDPEAKLTVVGVPVTVDLEPGASTSLPVRVKGRRRLLGDHRLRPFEVRVTDAEPEMATPVPPTQAVFVQRPIITRGLASLAGLLVALTVFAVVIVAALGSVVHRSTADRDLALEVAQARQGGATTGKGEIGGTVLDLSSGAPVAAMSVAAFAADDTTTALGTVATDTTGAFSLRGLPAGSYVLRVQGAGYSDVWYPAAAAPGDATQVEVTDDRAATGLVAVVGGTPAALEGTVTGDDVGGAVLQVQLPLSADNTLLQTADTQRISAPGETSGTTDSGAGGIPAGAVVATVPIGSDGSFKATGLPSPAIYDLVVTKSGYATTVQRVDVAAGEERDAVKLALQVGDGTVSGAVSSLNGPIGGATITATSGQTTVETVSLTQDDVGSFVLRNLPTPGSYTLTASADGYASASVSVSLGEGQDLTGLSLVLGTDTATLSGKVTVKGGSAAGVAVTVSDGSLTLKTVTQSSPVGAWRVSGLRVPSTYTVTFSRAGLESQVLSVAVDGFGKVTAGAPDAASVDTTMRASTASLSGVVRQAGGTTTSRVGNVTVTVSSGSVQRVVTTQSTPAGQVGYYVVDGLPPGTYTVTFTRPGTSASSTIVTLDAGESRTLSPVLIAPASISGQLTGASSVSGLTVNLYRATDYGTAAAPAATTTTDASGAYSFAQVGAPEHYIIEVRSTPGGSILATTAPFKVAASQVVVKNVDVG